MNSFLKGIFHDQLGRGDKMLARLKSPDVSKEIDAFFLQRTVEMLTDLTREIKLLIDSGDLDIDALASNNIVKYNTFHEGLLNIEIFRYLVIVNYGRPEEYFKKKVKRIYSEINCFQKPPIITTISNSENYYWALPSYDIIAVPTGEERNLLNLPDLFHEMGHLIYNQYASYLKGTIEATLANYYRSEAQRVINEQRASSLTTFYGEKLSWWKSSWVMEFTCDLIATYLVGPAFAWTNLKLTTLSSGQNGIYLDSPSHPSDEARMRAVFFMLGKMGHTVEVAHLQRDWNEFLAATKNPVPTNYSYIFPQPIIEELCNNVYDGCKMIDLRIYSDQLAQFPNPISKMLNDAWNNILQHPEQFQVWEEATIQELEKSL